ncbi:putative bifunctional diguanylate cyclase/phosphodiesterase [Marinomonas epiphytica]
MPHRLNEREQHNGSFFDEIFKPLTIPNEHKDRFRFYQFCTIARILPLALIATLCCLAGGLYFAWGEIHPEWLVVWAGLLFIIAGFDFVIWWLYIVQKRFQEVGLGMVNLLTLSIITASFSYALLSIHLFSIFSDRERIYLLAIVAAFISSGSWMFASVPRIGLGWAITFCASLVVGWIISFGASYWLLSSLTLIYGITLCCMILIFARRYLEVLLAEAEIERQHQTVRLLLNDFEENASDWLWETDSSGRLQYLSPKLIEAWQFDPSELNNQPYTHVLGTLLANNVEEAKHTFSHLAGLFHTHKSFNHYRLPVKINDEIRWWSLTAKPLYGKKQQFIGWRGVTSDITSDVLREQEMLRQANTDTLTGIGNRQFFNNCLKGFFDKHTPYTKCALILLDLDNFKSVNDSFGHIVGDQLITEVSHRLARFRSSKNQLARLGGDEFAFIVSDYESEEALLNFTKQLRKSLSAPWQFEGGEINILASIGISTSSNNETQTIETLLRASDLALYAAKNSGRNTTRVFDPTLREQADHKHQILSEMRQAILMNEFQLYFQPKINLADGKIQGFEALARWQHPKKGIITPDKFISISEESGLIIPLGAWVLEKACQCALDWPSNLTVAVNVSAHQLSKKDFLSDVRNTLDKTGLSPERLEIEVTESALLKEQLETIQLLSGLQNLGVKVALDDFGTGFSSLSYLQTLPIDILKIDQSFINKTDSDSKAFAIVQSITQLAHALNLKIIAEGIERKAQVKRLLELNIEAGQGYLYARPMPDNEVKRYIKSIGG